MSMSRVHTDSPCGHCCIRCARSTQTEKFAERRRGELDAYLARLMAEPDLRGSRELHSFLELGLLIRRTNAGRYSSVDLI